MHPQNVYLDTSEHRRDYYAQYIPLPDTLRAILKDPVVWQECLEPQNRLVSDGILSDISDGSIFKSSELFLQTGDVILKLIMYQEAFEVVNPLGSTRNKHYWSILYTC